MFARNAKSRGIDRRYKVSTPSAPVCSNDNQIHGRIAGIVARPGQQALVCRWQASPVTGRPECHWETKNVHMATAEEPEPSWPKREAPWRLGTCLLGSQAVWSAMR
jgi:hypothetical protein